MDQTLRQRLIDMVEEARRMRNALAADGSLFVGYNDTMRATHNAHARSLADIVDSQGWPDTATAGADGAAAAWIIAQHAIGLPRFMRACLEMIEEAAAQGRVPRWQAALLTDRVRWLEGRPQVYGTQFDWNAAGELVPLPIEDEANVDSRRALADLTTMAEGTKQRREEARQSGETAPGDWAARQADFEAWAKAIGWRS
ncbi:DUF6624 domain-containing protein [Ferrovibrio xuzhouensis]|uniref:DUF6624 domain-containing protein n=1 Tax=Ferrovibrio xuzhouensis TaxID=1576914 RepID=A0ABV7VEH1_9PROT